MGTSSEGKYLMHACTQQGLCRSAHQPSSELARLKKPLSGSIRSLHKDICLRRVIACFKSPRLIIGLEGRRLLQPLTLGFPIPLLTPSLINAKQAPPFSHMKQEMQYLPRQPH